MVLTIPNINNSFNNNHHLFVHSYKWFYVTTINNFQIDLFDPYMGL